MIMAWLRSPSAFILLFGPKSSVAFPPFGLLMISLKSLYFTLHVASITKKAALPLPPT